MTDYASPDRLETKERKGNVARIVWSRDVHGECQECDLTTTNSGAAASHARATRHEVVVRYSTLFSFVPRTNDGGGSA